MTYKQILPACTYCRWAGRQADLNDTDRRNMQIYRETYKLTYMQTDMQTYRQTDVRQADNQADRQTYKAIKAASYT